MQTKIVYALLLLFTVAAPVALQAQAQAGGDWSHVEMINTGTMLHISSQQRRHPTVCSFVAAEADSLTCTQTHHFFFVPVTRTLLFTKQEITSIKLSRRSLSLLAGAAIGGGAGAGIGAAIDASAKSREDGRLATAVGGILGAAIGAGVGSGLDFLAGPTLYRVR